MNFWQAILVFVATSGLSLLIGEGARYNDVGSAAPFAELAQDQEQIAPKSSSDLERDSSNDSFPHTHPALHEFVLLDTGTKSPSELFRANISQHPTLALFIWPHLDRGPPCSSV